jgi:hypothetical protein
LNTRDDSNKLQVKIMSTKIKKAEDEKKKKEKKEK